MLIKLGLVLVVFILAAANRYRILPRLERGSPGNLVSLRALVSAELVLILAVAGVSGSLVHSDPTIAADSGPVSTLLDTKVPLDDDHSVQVQISVESKPTLDSTAQILDAEGNVLVPDGDVIFAWTLPDQNLGPITQTVVLDVESETYTGQMGLPIAGEWELEISAGIDRFTDSRTIVFAQVP